MAVNEAVSRSDGVIFRCTLTVFDMCAWLRRNQVALDHTSGVNVIEGPMIMEILAELEADLTCVEDMGALNRWPKRSEVPISEYLHLWQVSCAEIFAGGRLPTRLVQALCIR